jgi:hypothetical protein
VLGCPPQLDTGLRRVRTGGTSHVSRDPHQIDRLVVPGTSRIGRGQQIVDDPRQSPGVLHNPVRVVQNTLARAITA